MPPVPCPDIFLRSTIEKTPQTTTIMTTRRLILFFLSLALGLGLSLYYGWVVDPIQYRDTAPTTLRIDYQTDYTLMIAEVFQSDQNIDLAAERISTLGSQSPADIATQSLSFAKKNGYSSADVALLQDLVLALQLQQPAPTAGAKP